MKTGRVIWSAANDIFDFYRLLASPFTYISFAYPVLNSMSMQYGSQKESIQKQVKEKIKNKKTGFLYLCINYESPISGACNEFIHWLVNTVCTEVLKNKKIIDIMIISNLNGNTFSSGRIPSFPAEEILRKFIGKKKNFKHVLKKDSQEEAEIDFSIEPDTKVFPLVRDSVSTVTDSSASLFAPPNSESSSQSGEDVPEAKPTDCCVLI